MHGLVLKRNNSRLDAHTDFIHHCVAIGEAPSWTAIEVNAVGEIVGLGERGKIVVISVVNERVSEYEHGRYHLRPSPPTLGEWIVSTTFKLPNTCANKQHPHSNSHTVAVLKITHQNST